MGSPRDLMDLGPVEARPRRKYEVDDADVDGKSRIGLAVGAIAVSAFVFLKEALFGAVEAAHEGQKQNHVENHHGENLKPRKTDFAEDTQLQSESQGDAKNDLSEMSELGSGTVASMFFGKANTFELPGLTGRADTSAAPFLVSEFQQAENDNLNGGAGSINPFLRTGAINFNSGGAAPPPASSNGPSASVNGDSVVVEGGDNDQTDGDVPDDTSDDDDDVPPVGRMNRAPLTNGPVTLDSLLINQSIIIVASQLLLGASDPDDDSLYILNLKASSGTISLLSEDVWYYEPALNYVGDVSFAYNISDGELDVDQAALLQFSQAPGETISGSEIADTLVGTAGNDTIKGLGGDDVILGRDGDDALDGGEGDDRIVGGDGDDTIYGGPGDDLILGGNGDDVIFGSDGNDTIFGEEGNDLIFGEPGNDNLNGGSGHDVVEGGEDDDHIWGEIGNDLLDGGQGDDTIFGGAGNDTIIGGSGHDSAQGGEDDDVFIAQYEDDDDEYDGGEGFDTYTLERTSAAATVDLAEGSAESGDIGFDVLTGFEGIIGSQGGDTLFGSDGDNRLRGDDGDDVIAGGAGNDELRGDDGDDLLDGGDGDDEIEGDDGDDIIIGGLGSDVAEGDDGDDYFIALTGDGDDFYEGDDGSDTYDLSQTSANAVVDLAAGTAISADSGSDQLVGFENVIGGSGDDVLLANESVNVFYGGEGADTFVFRTHAEAGLSEGLCDRIEDFEIGDRIDLSFIDADNDEDGNQSFEFVLDSNSQTGKGNLVMRFDFDDDDDSVIDTIIAGFVNDDQLPDFEICIAGQHYLSASDFIGVNTAMSA